MVLSLDRLTLFHAPFSSPGSSSPYEQFSDIMVSSRASPSDSFSPAVPVPNVNSPEQEWPLYLTEDGCQLYLASNRPGGVGGYDIWVARRPR
jgi:hypothetical protein